MDDSSTSFVQIVMVCLPLTRLWQGQIHCPIPLYGKYVYKPYSQNVLKTNGRRLKQQNSSVAI